MTRPRPFRGRGTVLSGCARRYVASAPACRRGRVALRICRCRSRPPGRPAVIASLAWPLATSQRPGGRGALAARRLAEGLAGCCLGLPSFLSSSPCPVTLPWPMPAPGIAALACSPGPCAALRAAACARVPLPALALRPQCTGRRTQERRRQQSPELPQCPQTTPQQRALNLGIRVA